MATLKEPFALDRSLNTTEVTPRNIADVLAEELSRITGRNASQVEYDNTESELTADNVQDALDEIVEDIPTVPSVDIQTAVDEFSTYNGGILDSLKVSLEPIQDLHGYAEPWVGGAGKNKLEDTFNTGTLLDVVISVDNGVIDLNGTGTGENSFAIKSRNTSGNYIYMPKGSYIFSAQGIGSGVVIGTTYNGAFSEIARNDSGESVAFSITDNTPSDYKLADGSVLLAVYITVHARAYNHQKVYPMIRLSSVVDDTFAPYSNICPISGHTQVEVENEGKNRFNPNSYESIDITGGGAIRYGHSYDSGDYTISNNGNGVNYYYRIPKKDLTDRGTSINITGNAEINVSVDNAHMLWVFTSDITMADAEDISVIKGLNKPYVPYNGYQVTVNLGGTYYSGTLDVVTGVFTPDTASDDLGSLTWQTRYTGSVNKTLSSSLSQKPLWAETAGEVQCEDYKYNGKVSGVTAVSDPDNCEVGLYLYYESSQEGNAKVCYLVIPVNNSPDGKVVYELNDTTPIQLSPTMVKALVGENHLSAPLDGQEITESKYKQMFTFDDVIAYIQSLS